jgi:hypothetical protein
VHSPGAIFLGGTELTEDMRRVLAVLDSFEGIVEHSAGWVRPERGLNRFVENEKSRHGFSVPVKHPGRKMRAPWPARQATARKKKPATPVGMTEKKKRRKLSALESKSPPFAKCAKGGAPSSSFVERPNLSPIAQPGMAVPRELVSGGSPSYAICRSLHPSGRRCRCGSTCWGSGCF